MERVCKATKACEVDPLRCTDTRQLAANWRQLVEHMRGLWQVLANSLDACPPPLRQLLHCIAETVGAAFAGVHGDDLDVANKAVGGLFFLRFVCPALLHP